MDTLKRFEDAQENVYQIALKEIVNGKKESHWMWYIFPQLRGLGRSQMAFAYGINGLEEAKAYLNHPVLSARLIEITEALLIHKGKRIEDIMGYIDDLKLQSSMTLFAATSKQNSVFHQVLDCFYDGEMDEATLMIVRR